MRIPIRKRHPNITARELAAKHGVCVRTVRYIVAEKREDFEKRASDRRKLVFDMRHNQRKPFSEIADAANTTIGGAYRLYDAAKREHRANQ